MFLNPTRKFVQTCQVAETGNEVTPFVGKSHKVD